MEEGTEKEISATTGCPLISCFSKLGLGKKEPRRRQATTGFIMEQLMMQRPNSPL